VSDAARTPWPALTALLERADSRGIEHHGLAPVAARLQPSRRTEFDRSVRAAAVANASAIVLLRKVRECCDGPLLVIKGPEVAKLYPGTARRFSDVDLLSPQADQVQAELQGSGFTFSPTGDERPHHLHTLRWPTLALDLEVHRRVNWPIFLEPPATDAILAGAVPSQTGVEGVLAPNPIHHSLILAAHSWKARPLSSLRDLLDIALVSAEADRRDLDRTAAAWGIPRIWRATAAAIDATFFGARQGMAQRLIGRHLNDLREETTLESHATAWLSSFWSMSTSRALEVSAAVVYREVRRRPGETWQGKLGRSLGAFRGRSKPLSEYMETSWQPSDDE